MGIISDILEFNRERTGQLLSALPTRRTNVSARRSQVLACPICSELLIDEAALQRHILDRHRYLQVYVRLNGAVLPEVAFIDQPVTQLTAVLLGDSAGTINFFLDEHLLLNSRISPGRPLAIEKHIPADFIGRMELQISIGKSERSFLIYCQTQPELDVDKLDEAIWTLQKPLLDGCEPDWSEFRQTQLHSRTGTYLAKRYLRGFYSYLLGSYLETQASPQAGKHLEEALGQLRPFSTMMAHTARCVLALKLNAFKLLKDCGPESRFYDSNRFFNNLVSKTVARQLQGPTAEQGLWVDGFLEQLLKAIMCFNKADFVHAERLIAELRTSPYFREPNNHDKVTLLQARTAAALHKPDEAKRAYIRLVHNSLFGEEAEAYCE